LIRERLIQWLNGKSPRVKRKLDVLSVWGHIAVSFVADFADVVRPLPQLTVEKNSVAWTEECQRSFDKLKQLLTATPILAYPSVEGIFRLDRDASGCGIGVVLSQLQDGQERVLSLMAVRRL
jgi:hypothetical protein